MFLQFGFFSRYYRDQIKCRERIKKSTKNYELSARVLLMNMNQAHDSQEQWSTLYAYNWFEYKFR